MLDILMRGVSTRQYRGVIPEMADTVGVSKSSVSRQMIEASEAEVEGLLGRRFDDANLLIIYIDGMEFGDHVMIGAVGVDVEGRKHVLAIREGATENAIVAKELLEDLVARGVNPDQKHLFVIDGSKALRAAINAVFGARHPVQRCRAHKLRNVMDHLPKDQKDQVRSAMRAAWKLDAQGGMARMKKLAEWLERDYPAAAASLREGLEECFTINQLDVPASLHRCLSSTNIIEGPHSNDLAKILLGGQEGRGHPALCHAAIAPAADTARPQAHARMRTFDDVGAGQATVQRGRHVQPVDGETLLQPLAQAGRGRRIVAF